MAILKARWTTFFSIWMMALATVASGQSKSPSPEPKVDPMTAEIVAKHGFREFKLNVQDDWITFYYHAPEKSARKLVVFLSGSTPDTCFSYERKDGKLLSYFWGHQDYRQLPPDYAFVVIAKRGVEGALNENAPHETPAIYLEKNSLDYRVWQADHVIDYCCRNLVKRPEKVIVYGHSEGAPVAARLGTVNKRITHLGFWCGNALPDYYEFALMRRKEFLSGKISDAEAQQKIGEQLADYASIFASPNDTSGHGGSKFYTNKRWTSYAEAPVNDLLKIKIPLYVQVCTLDQNAPVETTYMIPIEFIHHGKKNLSYNVNVGWDHSFNEVDATGKKTSHWDEVFQAFLRWTETTPKAGK